MKGHGKAKILRFSQNDLDVAMWRVSLTPPEVGDMVGIVDAMQSGLESANHESRSVYNHLSAEDRACIADEARNV